MDTDLVESAQHGDKGAFTSLAAAMADRFLATSHRILRDMSLAEDATQQALLTVWQDLPQLRDPARFDAWSYRILVRACYAEAKRMRRWTPNIHLLPADEPVAPDGLGSVVDRDQLERGFRRLSLDHRTVVVLHHYLDLPLDQVADIVGISAGTVASRLHYAMRGLRAALDADARLDLARGCAMSTDRDVTRIVRSWLHEDAYEDADRVLDLVLDQLDTTPQRRATWWPVRRPTDHEYDIPLRDRGTGRGRGGAPRIHVPQQPDRRRRVPFAEPIRAVCRVAAGWLAAPSSSDRPGRFRASAASRRQRFSRSTGPRSPSTRGRPTSSTRRPPSPAQGSSS